MKTARNQTNPTKRRALGVVALASLQSLKTAMHTSPKLSTAHHNGATAIASVRAARGCLLSTSFNQRHSGPVSQYGEEWNTANIRGKSPVEMKILSRP